MLSPQVYWGVILIYSGSGVVALFLGNRYWFGALPCLSRRILVGVLAGLLLAPAYPSPAVQTLAPALIVALFNAWFGDSWVSAIPALTVLSIAVGIGVFLGAISTRIYKCNARH